MYLYKMLIKIYRYQILQNIFFSCLIKFIFLSLRYEYQTIIIYVLYNICVLIFNLFYIYVYVYILVYRWLNILDPWILMMRPRNSIGTALFRDVRAGSWSVIRNPYPCGRRLRRRHDEETTGDEQTFARVVNCRNKNVQCTLIVYAVSPTCTWLISTSTAWQIHIYILQSRQRHRGRKGLWGTYDIALLDDIFALFPIFPAEWIIMAEKCKVCE